MSSSLHFPARLYQLIEIEDPTIIQWELSGKSFRIVDSKRFKNETIPKYFRHGNPSSIQRQLNLYGFRCVNRVDEKGVYSHPQFVRGEYDAVRNIRRKRTWAIKGTGKKQGKTSAGPSNDNNDDVDSISDDEQELSQQPLEIESSKDCVPAEKNILALPDSVSDMAFNINNVIESAASCSSIPCTLDSFFDELQEFCGDTLDFDHPFDLFCESNGINFGI